MVRRHDGGGRSILKNKLESFGAGHATKSVRKKTNKQRNDGDTPDHGSQRNRTKEAENTPLDRNCNVHHRGTCSDSEGTANILEDDDMNISYNIYMQ